MLTTSGDRHRVDPAGHHPDPERWSSNHTIKGGFVIKGRVRAAALVVIACAASVGLAACGSDGDSTGTGGGDGAVSLRIGYVTTPQHPYGLAIQRFKEEVEEASDGNITINTLPGASQGNDVTLLDDVSGGSIEMAGVSAAVWDNKDVNVFQPLMAPFVIDNYALSETVLGGEIGQKMLESPNGPPKLGLVGLGILEGGLRKPVGKTALRSVADFRGKKIRAPASKIMVDTLRALGAEPVSMPLGDVAPALQNGTVDGLEANYGLIVTQKFYEGADFVTADVSLWPFPAVVVINKEQWDGLSADQQKILSDAGKNLAKNSVESFTNPAPGATDFVQVLCDEGMTFATAGAVNRAALVQRAEPALEALRRNQEEADLLKEIQDAKAAAGEAPAPAPLPEGCKTT